MDRKEEFIRTSAHQLQTLISGIKWALAALKETGANLNPEQKNIVGLAFDNVNRMIAIVSGMLDVAEVEEQATLLKPEPFAFGAFVEEIIAESRLLAQEKKISIRSDIPKDFTVTAVRRSLKQALANVVDNALRYSERPGSAVTISSAVEGKNAVIRISDQGIGMNEEQSAKAFTKFFRAPEAIKASPDGSGLGLYYTRRIIEQHGGEIALESVAGQGTTVTIELPVAQPPKSP